MTYIGVTFRPLAPACPPSWWMRGQANSGPLVAARALYRILAARWHPDLDRDGQHTEDWQRLQAAKLLLSQNGIL